MEVIIASCFNVQKPFFRTRTLDNIIDANQFMLATIKDYLDENELLYDDRLIDQLNKNGYYNNLDTDELSVDNKFININLATNKEDGSASVFDNYQTLLTCVVKHVEVTKTTRPKKYHW